MKINILLPFKEKFDIIKVNNCYINEINKIIDTKYIIVHFIIISS